MSEKIVPLQRQPEPQIEPEARTVVVQMILGGLLVGLVAKGLVSREEMREMLLEVAAGVEDAAGYQRPSNPQSAAFLAAAERDLVGGMLRALGRMGL